MEWDEKSSFHAKRIHMSPESKMDRCIVIITGTIQSEGTLSLLLSNFGGGGEGRYGIHKSL